VTLALLPLVPGEEAYSAFTEALREAGLPTEDLDGGARFYMGQDADAVVAFGGLEGNGPDQLIRSVVVPASARGGGYGRQVAQALAAQARADGAERLWLLTTSADAFFAGLGWTPLDRGDAPETVRGTRQSGGLCPASAVLMCRHLA
jgi:amino-acid N-acetyltransferase